MGRAAATDGWQQLALEIGKPSCLENGARRLLRISCLESKKRKTRRDLFNSGDGALGVRTGKRHIKPFRNGLGDQAQAGSPGFPMNATLGIRWIDGPSQVVPTHQVPTGAENQQRQCRDPLGI